ncbi:coiled-coil domain-containing protein 40 isoform X2 [Hemicordylus capensis]|uniref:coiled-coil domain-containing protein 40 isoform X2 n=1 Tax=Hemicordylus capensis TaxID=884348 RepID=UPI0023049614|nr:coiled-coil domain-containing protein 40 isoform X2 [Hemicordylus capensis]
MEPSTGTDSDHGQVTEDENKELLANDEETEVTSAREEEAGDTPIAVAEEEAAGAPMAAVEEEVGIAPMAAAEEEAAGAPMAAVEEEVGIAPMAAAEEEAAGAPMAAVEEEVGIAPMAAAEEEAAGAPMAAAEEEVGSAPMASVEEEIETVPVAVLEERPTAERDEPDTTWQGILEYGEPSFVQLSDASSVRIEVGSIPSRYYSVEQAVISPQSSTTSSLGSEEAVQGEHHLEIGAARSVFFSPYSDAALRPLALQLRGLGPTEEEETILRFTEQELGSGEQEEETQLIVLDPEHPLMKRFQAALKAYLNKQLGKLAEELREQAVAMKNSKIQREDLGVTLYGVQQQLARLQMELEKNHSRHSQIAMTRRQLEEELQDLRSMYKKTCQGTSEERKKVSAMQSEIENMSLRLFYMQNMDQDVRDDIAVMKRTVKKAEVERMRAEVEKQKQDLHVDRLTRRADELQEQIALYEAQYMAQAEDTRITRKEVGEACTEIQAIHLEKKQLLHQWTVSLTGMKRRDEAYAAMQEALRDSRHKLKSLEIEIEVYKKSISKEEERNELLASILNRAENDANTSRKLIAQSMTKQDAMKVELGTYTRTLQETEQALGRANVDRAARMNELVAIRREIEKGTEIKQEMENEIVAKLQDQLMSNKAAKYFLQLAAKLQSRMMDLDIELTKIENDTAQTMLDITNTTCKLNTLQKTFSEVDKEMDNMNNHISHSETEIAKRNLLIGRKQGVINLYNKKLEMMISQLGGQELGPLELEIKKLTKQIDDIESELVTLQRYWLKQQNVLVKLTQEREEQLTSLDMLKKEITIKEQKKVRIENEIQQEKNQLKDIERHMKNMANDLEKLHTLINKNSATSEELQQGNTIMENDFVRSLKVSERESIEMQEKLDHLREEKERLLNCLVEAECQMMQWEKKIQLAKEMRAAVDSETGQGDIRAMKSEIHRMQVRYSQLMRQQEKMMRDTEAAVARRETIVVRGEGQSKQNKQLLTKSDFHYKKLELMKKIKETQKNAAECNITIAHLEKTQKNISNTLLEKQKHNAILNVEIDELQLELDQLQIKKQQNLSDIVANQTRVKHMQAVKEGKYSPLYRTELIMRIERQKLEERLYGISVILHQIEQEFPQHYRTIRRLSQFLHSRLDETAAPEDGAGSQT